MGGKVALELNGSRTAVAQRETARGKKQGNSYGNRTAVRFCSRTAVEKKNRSSENWPLGNLKQDDCYSVQGNKSKHTRGYKERYLIKTRQNKVQIVLQNCKRCTLFCLVLMK